MLLKCGHCKKISDAEELTTYVYYKCKKCNKVNEVFNVKLTEWLGFQYDEYLFFINRFLRQYNFDDILAQNSVELLAGRLSQTQVNTLRTVMIGSFDKNLSLKEIAEQIDDRVKPKDLFRLKDGKIVKKKDGNLALAVSKERRGIAMARTETTRAGAEGSLLHYKDKKEERVRWVASLGARTCPICLDLNGQIFTIQEAGGLMPAHALCRCTYIPIS